MGKKVYIFTLEEDLVIKTDIKGAIYSSAWYAELHGGWEEEWLRIDPDGTITIKKGYSWDGCTPKRRIFGKVIGTWDGPISPVHGKPMCYYPSCLHDALYQFKYEIPVSRKQADVLFYEGLKQEGFKLAKLYYTAVRVFGGTLGKWKTK